MGRRVVLVIAALAISAVAAALLRGAADTGRRRVRPDQQPPPDRRNDPTDHARISPLLTQPAPSTAGTHPPRRRWLELATTPPGPLRAGVAARGAEPRSQRFPGRLAISELPY